MNVYKDQGVTVTDKVNIHGNDADVEVSSNSGKGVNFHLEKEGNAWKVDFNMNALLNMVKDAIKETGVDIQKEVNDAVDSIKINLDSTH
jgi:hypothetical protein